MNRFTTLFTVTIVTITSLQLKANEGIEKSQERNNISLIDDTSSSEEGIKNKVLITGSAGLNYLGRFLQIKYGTNDLWLDYENYIAKVSSSEPNPLLNIGVDYGVEDKVSAGLAFGYQKVILTERDYLQIGVNPVTQEAEYVDLVDTWTRLHFAVRFDYHIVARENVGFYSGVKMGYNSFNVSSSLSEYDDEHIEDLKVFVRPSQIAAQAHLGLSVYFGGLVGFNTEVGLSYGGPYNAAVGLTIKI